MFISGLAALTIAALSRESRADTWCVLSNFVVDAYDHGGVYVHGTLSGSTYAQFVVLCGTVNGAQSCDSKATDRRLATALTAQASGRNLNLYIAGITNCADYQPYTTPTTIQMLN